MAALAATAACVFALAGPAQADLDPRDDSYNGLRASGTPSGYTYIPTLRLHQLGQLATVGDRGIGQRCPGDRELA